jgi:hypothetical protein
VVKKYFKIWQLFFKMEILQQNLPFFSFFSFWWNFAQKNDPLNMSQSTWNYAHEMCYYLGTKESHSFPNFIANFWNFFCWHFIFLLVEMNMFTYSNLESFLPFILFIRHNNLEHNQEPPRHSSKTWTIGWNGSNHSNNPKIDYVW